MKNHRDCTAEQLPTDCERIDVQGALVTPGLFDVHIHGSGGCDTMDGTEQALHTIASTVVKNGVTRFLATSVTLPLERTAQVFDTVREVVGKSGEGWDAAVIEGINMEGPFINPAYKGAHEENYIADVDFDFMQRYSDVIRLVTVAPEKSGAMEFIKKLTTQTSIRVSIGHTAATYEQAMEAIEKWCDPGHPSVQCHDADAPPQAGCGHRSTAFQCLYRNDL